MAADWVAAEIAVNYAYNNIVEVHRHWATWLIERPAQGLTILMSQAFGTVDYAHVQLTELLILMPLTVDAGVPRKS